MRIPSGWRDEAHAAPPSRCGFFVGFLGAFSRPPRLPEPPPRLLPPRKTQPTPPPCPPARRLICCRRMFAAPTPLKWKYFKSESSSGAQTALGIMQRSRSAKESRDTSGFLVWRKPVGGEAGTARQPRRRSEGVRARGHAHAELERLEKNCVSS